MITPGAQISEKEEDNPKKFIRLNFDKFIKITKARHSYTELELLAEIGGYVGLFLGLSVFDFGILFDLFFKNHLYSTKKVMPDSKDKRIKGGPLTLNVRIHPLQHLLFQEADKAE